MFLAIEKAYTSPLSVVQVDNWLDYVEAKESGAWIFKSKVYEVKGTAFAFTLC